MTDCAEVSWDFVSAQLLFAGAFWVFLLLFGLLLSFCGARCINLDRLRERLDRCRSFLQDSYVFSILYGIVSIAQCTLFSLRTLTKSADYLTFSLDSLACLLFLMNLVVSWMRLFLESVLGGLVFMGSWALLDCVMIPSVISLVILEIDGAKTWFSFSYMSALHVLESWRWFLEIRQVNLQVLKWQVVDVAVSVVATVYFAAMMMMTLENLGDPPVLQGLNEETWNFVAALYYVFVTLSTVGYGDLAPRTALGRLFAIFAIFGGMSTILLGLMKIAQVVSLQRQGGGSFKPPPRTRHIVVTGNPTVQMVRDFITECFHPDHAEDALDLHLVFLLPRGTGTVGAIGKYLRLKENLHVASRVHLRQGSVMESSDLSRVSPTIASAFFILPDIQCKDLMHEDTENIIRMMAILKVAPSVRMILLLMRAEHEQLMHDSGVGTLSQNLTCLSMDQFKLQLVGKSCQVPGFATLICNLFKTISGAEEDDYLEEKGLSWLKDYDLGAENELYEVELSDVYTNRRMYFCDIVFDVLEQTEGKVYLIGLVETGPGQKRVLVNPGTYYAVKPTYQGVYTSGIFIAADRDRVKQSEDDGENFGRRDSRASEGGREGRKGSKGSRRPSKISGRAMASVSSQASVMTVLTDIEGYERDERGNSKASAGSTLSRAESQQSKVSTSDIIKRVIDFDPLHELVDKDPMLLRPEKESAKHLITLAQKQRKAAQPTPPPLEMLAKGSHILFLCLGAQATGDFRLGAEHFMRPLRGLEEKFDDTPVLLLSPVAPADWGKVSDFAHVFFLKGSALSLFDLERASFRAASVIFICHVGNPSGLEEQWMVDSEVICCTRLIEQELNIAAANVIVELTVDMNHPFVAQRATKGEAQRRGGVLMGSIRGGQRLGMEEEGGGGLLSALAAHKSQSGSIMDNGMIFDYTPKSKEPQLADYYRQPRFACGQLFVGNVVTSLVVNCYFNPTLWEILHTAISQEVVMVPVKYSWENKSYREYFDFLLKEKALLAVAIYRVADGPKDHPAPGQMAAIAAKNIEYPRRWCYVFTTPPAGNTKLMKGDSVICFGPTFATHRELTKAKKNRDSNVSNRDRSSAVRGSAMSSASALEGPPRFSALPE